MAGFHDAKSGPRASRACSKCKGSKIRCVMVPGSRSCLKYQRQHAKCLFPKSERLSSTQNPLSPQGLNVNTSTKLLEEVDVSGLRCSHLSIKTLIQGSTTISDEPHMKPNTGVLSTYPLDNLIKEATDLLASSKSTTNTKVNSSQRQGTFRVLNPIIPSDDVRFLLQKGAFDILPRQLQTQLLRAYVQYVHPLLPALDTHNLLVDLIIGDETLFKSPLLYQAVMFAASAFIGNDNIVRHGHGSRMNFRRLLFERLKFFFKLLYHFGIESDSLVQIQALLLMTQWWDSNMNHKDPSYWFDLACSTAEKLGLLSETHDGLLSHRRRVWWCLYARDRVISFAFRRPLRIRNNDSEVTMLDFTTPDFESYHPIVCDVLGSASEVLSPENQQRTLVLFKEFVKLTHHIGTMLEFLFCETLLPSENAEGVFSLALREFQEPSTILTCERFLRTWSRYLPQPAHYHPPFDQPVGSVERVLTTHEAFIHLLHLFAKSTLYQVALNSNLESGLNTLETIRDVTTQAKKTFVELYELDLLDFLPGTSIIGLRLILGRCIPDLAATDKHVRQQALANLFICEQTAWHMLRSYPIAQHVFSKAQIATSHLLGLIEN